MLINVALLLLLLLLFSLLEVIVIFSAGFWTRSGRSLALIVSRKIYE